MLTLLRTLFNNGDNDGQILIKTKDKDIRCHGFIVNLTSEFMKTSIDKLSSATGTIIELDFPSSLIVIIFNYLYSERIIDKELPAFDIIQLFNLIGQLKCHQSIIILKNHYLKKFPDLIIEDNWMALLTYVFNVSKYAELQEEIINYYTNNILNNIELSNSYMITNAYETLDNPIKNLLFSIGLKKISELNAELKNNVTEQENKKKLDLNSYLKNFDCESEEICDDDPGESNKVQSKSNNKAKPSSLNKKK